MELSKQAQASIEDLFADSNLEIDEMESVIKILCGAIKLENGDKPDINDVDNVLFCLQGKLSTIKNQLRIIEEIIQGNSST